MDLTRLLSNNNGLFRKLCFLTGELLSSHTLHYGSDYRPSAWFNTVMARRRKGVTPNTEEEAVDEIADAMEGDEKLMSDDVNGEIMRR